jgi:primosomal protein N''
MEQMMERLLAKIRTNLERLEAKIEANNVNVEVLKDKMKTQISAFISHVDALLEGTKDSREAAETRNQGSQK